MRRIVVIPTYNERENIAGLVEAVLASTRDLDVLVVDDNSPDGTAEAVTAAYGNADRGHLLCRTGPRGFGPSYIDGFKYALSHGYDAVFCMDADFSHDPACLPSLIDALETHDVVIGSRYCHGRISVVNWPLHRLVLSIFGGAYVRLITGIRASDPTSGFRGFRAYVLGEIDLDSIKSNGYSFLVETLHRVCRCGFSIEEVPIVFTERREGQSKMSRNVILEAAIMPWRLRFGRFRRRRPAPRLAEREAAAEPGMRGDGTEPEPAEASDGESIGRSDSPGAKPA